MAAQKKAAPAKKAAARKAEPAKDAAATPAKDAAALGKITGGMADKVTTERRKELAPLAPDEWIKRIRRLIAEGKNEDAAKELIAFRPNTRNARMRCFPATCERSGSSVLSA